MLFVLMLMFVFFDATAQASLFERYLFARGAIVAPRRASDGCAMRVCSMSFSRCRHDAQPRSGSKKERAMPLKTRATCALLPFSLARYKTPSVHPRQDAEQVRSTGMRAWQTTCAVEAPGAG